jgi:hypothetical protein
VSGLSATLPLLFADRRRRVLSGCAVIQDLAMEEFRAKHQRVSNDSRTNGIRKSGYRKLGFHRAAKCVM